ncbi:hypothetical protein ABT369_52120 [Dactylosporangium sp. NPDC000244]|uniref:hypothetical protein n=1 Tax=Dactylosporangium sp. NPDC000244 TaxID=3154365 RepID=UPI003333655C
MPGETVSRPTGDSPATTPAQTPSPTGAQTAAEAAPGAGTRETPIWDSARAEEIRRRWHDLQTSFVENPARSVGEARQLVDEAVEGLTASVRGREEQLERAGARSSDSTEGMRDAVLQYHHLLDRLLSV